jgi:hypothetical protein
VNSLGLGGVGGGTEGFIGWGDELQFIHDLESGALQCSTGLGEAGQRGSTEDIVTRRRAMLRRKSLGLIGSSTSIFSVQPPWVEQTPSAIAAAQDARLLAEAEAEAYLRSMPFSNFFKLYKSQYFLRFWVIIVPILNGVLRVFTAIFRLLTMEIWLGKMSLKKIRRYLYYAIMAYMGAAITLMVSYHKIDLATVPCHDIVPKPFTSMYLSSMYL